MLICRIRFLLDKDGLFPRRTYMRILTCKWKGYKKPPVYYYGWTGPRVSAKISCFCQEYIMYTWETKRLQMRRIGSQMVCIENETLLNFVQERNFYHIHACTMYTKCTFCTYLQSAREVNIFQFKEFDIERDLRRTFFFYIFFWGILFSFFSYNIQHCFICRPSDSTVPTDAGIEPRTVATGALAVRCSNH